MIIGIGCDIVEKKRVAKAQENSKFAERILSLAEIKFYETMPEILKTNFLAGRFAAKEAFSKALGCGIGAKLSFKDVSILNNEYGAPKLTCAIMQDNEVCHISIAHESDYAVAYCIIEN